MMSLQAIVMTFVGLHMLTSIAVSQYTRCENPAPGLNRMRSGVDVTNLDLTPFDFNRPDGFKSPVIEYTCNQAFKQKINGVEYDLPDQIWNVNPIPGGWLASDVKIFRNYKQIKEALSYQVGGGLQIEQFGFSASGSYTRMQDTLTNSSKYVEQVSSFDSATRADLLPEWALALDRVAQQYVDEEIHSTFAENPGVFENFISTFGTHYFRHAKFGGLIRLYMETDTEYFKKTSNTEIQAQAEASFLNLLSLKGGYTGSVGTIDERFEQLTVKTIRYYGGITNLLSLSGLSTWQPTVASQPWLFSGELAPISNLINDTVKRSAMEQAITNHLLRAYLGEQTRLISAMRARSLAGLQTLNSLLDKVHKMLGARLLVRTQVEALAAEIEEQISVPDWFTDRTQLCHQWYPEGEGAQCGGEGRLLCAKPGDMTPLYRDDSDRKPGGCRMQWGIQTSLQAEWFNQVQLCFRWHADGDSGQCGGGVNNELCAPVNTFTEYYRDDSDRRPGGCQMSWRLVVPDTAPVWAQNQQLCFSWHAESNSGQCSAPSPTMCSRANQWTDYYRDDTDRRTGGCLLSWGLKY